MAGWIENKIKSLANKIRAIVVRAEVKTPSPVVPGEYPTAQVSYLGTETDMENVSPYGLASALPSGALCLKFNIQGESSNPVGTAYDPESLPPLLVNEVAVGNFIAGAYLKFTNLGTIEVWKKVAGEDVLVIADLITHIHAGGTLTGGLTGPPKP